MYVKVQVKTKDNRLTTIDVSLSHDLKDYEWNTINDAVSDWLDENGVDYTWYDVGTLPDNEDLTCSCGNYKRLDAKRCAECDYSKHLP